MPSAREQKKWDKMIQKEQAEHPSFTPEQVRQIVQDHFQSRHPGKKELAFQEIEKRRKK